MYQRDFEFLNHSNNNILSVVLMADSFFYSIIDSNQRLLSHKSYENIRFSENESIAVILNDHILNAEYRVISVLCLMDECMFLPNLDDLLIGSLPSFENKQIKVEKFLSKKIYCYFGITIHQEHLLQNLFGKNDYQVHHVSNALMSNYIANHQKVIHGHIEQDHIHLFHMSEGSFKFYKCFDTNGIKDVLYFITAIYEEHGLDMSKEELVLSGWVEEDSPLFRLIKGYVGKVTMYNSLLFSLANECIETTKPHFYFAHHINAICAS